MIYELKFKTENPFEWVDDEYLTYREPYFKKEDALKRADFVKKEWDATDVEIIEHPRAKKGILSVRGSLIKAR